MTSTCLQQRDGYPYMFHDPLTLGSVPYAAHARPSCNPAAAHQQPPPQHTSAYGGGSASASSGTGRNSRQHTYVYVYVPIPDIYSLLIIRLAHFRFK